MTFNKILVFSEKASLSKDLDEKFKSIFPSIPMMISTLIAFVLVILILWFFLHKPIKKMVKERQKFIQNNIDKAKETNELSQTKLKEANERLAKAYEESNNLIKEAKIHGENVIAEYTKRAMQESKRITKRAELEMKNEREKLLEESKNNIAKTAIEISKQILHKEISKETQDKIINNFLNDKQNYSSIEENRKGNNN